MSEDSPSYDANSPPHRHQGPDAASAPPPPRRRGRGAPSLNPDTFSHHPTGVSPTVEQILGITVDLDEFIQPVRDTHGHVDRHTISLLPGHFVEAEKIVGSGRWPYRSWQDLLRHALHRHLRWLNTLYPQPTVMGQVNMLLETLREEEYMADMEIVFEKARGVLQAHYAARREDMARDFLVRVDQHIDDMPDGMWKGRFRAEFERQLRADLERMQQQQRDGWGGLGT